MFRVSFSFIATLCLVALVAGLQTANAQLTPLDSASFAYKYEMDNFPYDHPTVNLDGNGTADFRGATPAEMSVSGGVLNLDGTGAALIATVELDSDFTGSIWRNVSAPFMANGYTVEIRAQVLSTSAGYPDDLSANIALWTSPSGGSTQNAELQIAGAGVLWGGRDFEPISLNSENNMDAFHVFRFAAEPEVAGVTTYSVWRDGLLLAAELPTIEADNVPRDWMRIGAFHGFHNGVTDIDYVRFTEGAFAPPPIVSADFDSDGDVDGADFLTWQRGVGTTIGAMLADGDSDNDGDVDEVDLGVWETSFPTISSAAVSAVPEPSAFLLMAFASMVGFSWFRCFTKQ